MGGFHCTDTFKLDNAVWVRSSSDLGAIRPWLNEFCHFVVKDEPVECDWSLAEATGFTRKSYCSAQQVLKGIEAGVLRQRAVEADVVRRIAAIREAGVLRQRAAEADVDRRVAALRADGKRKSQRLQTQFGAQVSRVSGRWFELASESAAARCADVERWASTAQVRWQERFQGLPTYTFVDKRDGKSSQLKLSVLISPQNALLHIQINGRDPKADPRKQPAPVNIDAVVHLAKTPKEAEAWLERNYRDLPTVMANCEKRLALFSGSNDDMCGQPYARFSVGDLGVY